MNSVRAKVPEPILGHFDRQKSRGKLGIAPVRGGVCGSLSPDRFICLRRISLGWKSPQKSCQGVLGSPGSCSRNIAGLLLAPKDGS